MSKKFKVSILLLIITLGFLFLLQTDVNAADIESADTLKEAFEGKNATIDGTTITLTGDVELKNPNWSEGSDEIEYDTVYLGGNDYILNLNGHKLTAYEVYINDGSLTINDSTGNGELDTTADWLWVEEGAELIINNGNVDFLINNGTTTINNGVAEMLTNERIIVIEDGTFGGMWQRGTSAIIKGGTFTATTAASAIDLDTGTTVISGNVEFKRTEENNALMINSANSIDGEVINQLLGDGYISACSGYGTNSDSWFDEELGETVYRYEVIYEPIKIIQDETETLFNKIVPNGVWNINGSKPVDMEEAEFLLNAIAGDVEVPEGYEIYAFVAPADEFDAEVVEMHIYYNGSLLKSKTVKAVYTEPSEEVKTKVNSILDKIAEKHGENFDVDTGLRLEDLYLINYLNASSKGIDGSLALNFSKDLIALTNGGNISYKYDSRLGSFTPTGLWNYTGGQVIVYYDGVATGTTEIGLTTNHVLYVPSDTADTDEARIAAALKRIEDYLGTTKGITITVGGTLESLNKEGFTWKDYGFIDDKTSGTNYYNVTINGKTYKFAICKKDANELETPKYIGSDVISNISITSDATEIPLDTAITVKQVTSTEIEEAVGTSVYAAYDISLYSNAKQVDITKLENGKFIVSIPVPEILKDKEITIYYINSKGEKEDYEATVKDGVATFETNHFSTYVLAEVEEDNNNVGDTITGDNNTENTTPGNNTESNNDSTENTNNNANNNTNNSNNPNTGDNILIYLAMLLTAVIGIIITTKVKRTIKTK